MRDLQGQLYYGQDYSRYCFARLYSYVINHPSCFVRVELENGGRESASFSRSGYPYCSFGSKAQLAFCEVTA